MNKPMLGLCLGTVLGAIDGALAYSYPDVREHGMITGIVIGSMGKGLVAGLITGFIARKLKSLPLGILAGFLVFVAITYPIAIMKNPDTGRAYFWEIIIPGSICGAIVGFATQRYGTSKSAAKASAGSNAAQKRRCAMTSSPEQILEAMIANLPEKTGKSLDQWIAIAKKSGAQKHGEIVKFLKSEHSLGHGYANIVAQRTLSEPAGGDDLVEAQYAGTRAALKPIHDAIVAAAKKLGRDVEISPKKTCVSLRRARQFALIQPSTNTRIDLGLKLDGVPIGGRLEKWPSTMCTHRVRLESVKDVDQALLGWIAKAYEQAG